MPREGRYKMLYKATENDAQYYLNNPREYPRFGPDGWFMAGRPVSLQHAQEQLEMFIRDAQRGYNNGWKCSIVRVA